MGNLFTKAQPIVSNSESIREQNSNLGLDGILNRVLNNSLQISSLKYCLMRIKAKATVLLAKNPQIVNGCIIGASAIAIGALVWYSLGEENRKQIEYKIRTTIHEAINIGKKSAEIAWKMALEKLSFLKARKEITESVALTAMSEYYKIPLNKEQFQDYILQISKDTTNIERSDMDFTPLDIRNIVFSLHSNYSDQIENGLTPEHALHTSFERLISDVRTLIAIKKQIPIETIDLEIDKNKIDKVISTMVPPINTITTMIIPQNNTITTTLIPQNNTITTSNNNRNDVNININIGNKNNTRLFLNINTST